MNAAQHRWAWPGAALLRFWRRTASGAGAPEPPAPQAGDPAPQATGPAPAEAGEPAPPTPSGPAPTPSSGPGEAAILLLAGAAAVGIGQLVLPELAVERRWQGFAFLVAGMLAFTIGVHGFSRGRLVGILHRPLSALARWFAVARAQALLLLLSPVLSAAAWIAAGDRPLMRYPALALALFAAALLFLLLGARPPARARPWARPPLGEVALVAALVLLAFAARGLWLSHIPWVFTGDEGSAGLAAIDVLEGREANPFTTSWFSFPSLYFYIEALSIWAFGRTFEAARLPAALAGVLTVAGLYWYARPTFGRGVALAASAYLVTFPIHIHFSRTGLNNIWDTLTMVVFSGALWRGWTRNARGGFVLAGLAAGIGMYFYPSVRVLAAMVPLWLLAALLKDRRAFAARLPGVAMMALAAAVAFLPLGLYYLENPQHFAAPMRRVSALGPWLEREVGLRGGDVWSVVWTQLRDSAQAYTTLPLRGHFNNAPMFLPLAGALFLLGVCLALLRLRSLEYVWLILWLLASIAVGALSESTPTSQRYLFTAGAAAVLIVLPVVEAARGLGTAWPRWRRLAVVGAGGLLAVAMAADLAFYFGDYSAKRAFGDLNTETASAVALYLHDQEPGQRVYFLGPPRMGYNTHATIAYLVPGAVGSDVVEPLTDPPDWALEGPTIFILLPERREELAFVQQAYPQGVTHSAPDRRGELLFIAYAVDPG